MQRQERVISNLLDQVQSLQLRKGGAGGAVAEGGTIVVGGGIMGASTASALASKGERVTLIDGSSARSLWCVAAGRSSEVAH